jgi:glycine cleavage system protein P-like pyridoxal-binding family
MAEGGPEWGMSLDRGHFPKLNYFFSPICVAKHLAPFLPSHPIIPTGGERSIDAVSAAPWGSASILLISWAYIKMLGGQGLVDSSKIALLSANYMAHRLSGHYSLRYKNANGRVAHELLIDFAEFDKSAGLKVTDFAKRLQVSHTIVPPGAVPLTRHNSLGLRFPSANCFMAHFNVHAYRANGV